MTDEKPKIQMTARMGRIWVGCEHGQPDDPPHLCFDCYTAAIHAAMERIANASGVSLTTEVKT